jgi:hypothetical protein
MRIAALLLMSVAAALISCTAAKTATTTRAVAQPVVLPSYMCAQRGVAAASNDRPGDRMICEFEEPTGSHLQKCVCHDEQEIVATREATQQYLRDLEIDKCVAHGGGTCTAP